MKFIFTAVEFRSIASVGVVASKEDITPIIGVINLSLVAGEFHAVSTDRYRIARSRFTPTVEQGELPEEFSLNMDAPTVIKWWNSIKVEALKGFSHIYLETVAGDMPGEIYYKLSFNGNVISSPEVRGNFPPVERLMEIDLNEYQGLPQVSLNPSFVADLTKLFAADDYAKPTKNVGWTFHFGSGETSKPKPVYITRKSDRGGAAIDYLLQPVMILR